MLFRFLKISCYIVFFLGSAPKMSFEQEYRIFTIFQQLIVIILVTGTIISCMITLAFDEMNVYIIIFQKMFNVFCNMTTKNPPFVFKFNDGRSEKYVNGFSHIYFPCYYLFSLSHLRAISEGVSQLMGSGIHYLYNLHNRIEWNINFPVAVFFPANTTEII